MEKERLEKRVTFRVTARENKKLNEIAQLLGCRPSDAMRIALESVTFAANELAAQK